MGVVDVVEHADLVGSQIVGWVFVSKGDFKWQQL